MASDNELPPCEPAGGSEGEIGVRYDTIREMMDDGRSRAALSHIEALENEQGRTQRSQLWRAQALRRIGHLEVAGVIYRGLIQGCPGSEAYHGLGKVAGGKSDWIEAERMLKKAVRLDPISPRKHNDLGYAHLKAGASDLAIEEFRTALELDPGRSRSANNLVLALLIAEEDAEAERIADRLSLDPERWQALQRQAEDWEIERGNSRDRTGTEVPVMEEEPMKGNKRPSLGETNPTGTGSDPGGGDGTKMPEAAGESPEEEPESLEEEEQP